MEKEFRSDYERLKYKFKALQKEHKELKEDYENAEHYNDYLRKKLKKTEKELNEYQLLLSNALKRKWGGFDMKISVYEFIFELLLFVLFILSVIDNEYELTQLVLLFIIAREIIDIQKLLKRMVGD